MAEIERAESATDPERCQGVMAYGQCGNKSMEGSLFCPMHGGNKAVQSAEAKDQRNYRVAKWQARMNRMSDAPGIKSLREDIGVLRMLLEERLNQCHSESELMMQSQPIAQLVEKIEHTVVSCHKLEEKLNVVVDRQQLLQFASQVIDIVSKHTQEDQLQVISDEILQVVGKLGGEDAD